MRLSSKQSSLVSRMIKALSIYWDIKLADDEEGEVEEEEDEVEVPTRFEIS